MSRFSACPRTQKEALSPTNFLQFETKEMVLQKVWQKKGIQVGDKKIQFDHDYPTEIVQKRKTYLNIKKTLKEKGIRFQTPFTKIRIHWNNGVKNYDNVQDAAQDMKARGLTVASGGVDPWCSGMAASGMRQIEAGCGGTTSKGKVARIPEETRQLTSC